jgi:hypothetical protein
MIREQTHITQRRRRRQQAALPPSPPIHVRTCKQPGRPLMSSFSRSPINVSGRMRRRQRSKLDDCSVFVHECRVLVAVRLSFQQHARGGQKLGHASKKLLSILRCRPTIPVVVGAIFFSIVGPDWLSALPPTILSNLKSYGTRSQRSNNHEARVLVFLKPCSNDLSVCFVSVSEIRCSHRAS